MGRQGFYRPAPGVARCGGRFTAPPPLLARPAFRLWVCAIQQIPLVAHYGGADASREKTGLRSRPSPCKSTRNTSGAEWGSSGFCAVKPCALQAGRNRLRIVPTQRPFPEVAACLERPRIPTPGPFVFLALPETTWRSHAIGAHRTTLARPLKRFRRANAAPSATKSETPETQSNHQICVITLF